MKKRLASQRARAGANSEKLAHRAIKKVIRELKKGGIIILCTPRIKVVNMIASADIRGKVDLEEASMVLDNIMYEPKQFPGAVHRMKEPKVVILIFSSGRLVITGGPRGRNRPTRPQRKFVECYWKMG